MKALITFLMGMLLGALVLWGFQVLTTDTKIAQTKVVARNVPPLQTNNTLKKESDTQPKKSQESIESLNTAILDSSEIIHSSKEENIQPSQEYEEPDDFLFITSRVHQFNAENSGTYLNDLSCTKKECLLDIKFSHGESSVSYLGSFNQTNVRS